MKDTWGGVYPTDYTERHRASPTDEQQPLRLVAGFSPRLQEQFSLIICEL